MSDQERQKESQKTGAQSPRSSGTRKRPPTPVDDRPVELDDHTKQVFQREQYQIESKLSQGSFGVVFKGVKLTTGQQVAIKVIFLDKVSGKVKSHFLPREMAALMHLRHGNIVQILDIMTNGGKLFIFMDFANGGDISGYLKKNGAPLSEPQTAEWFTQIADALRYCHVEMHVAHRDIKMDNMLLHDGVAKLTDFGFATDSWDRETNRPKMSTTYCGTRNYFCPQLVCKLPYDAYAADCWAMGVSLFAMLNNKFPYHSVDSKAQYKEQISSRYLKSRYTKQFPDDLRHLIQSLLLEDEEVRLNITGVLAHPWIVRKGK